MGPYNSNLSGRILSIVLPYVFVSILYIYLSDYLLVALVHNIALLSQIQTYKGMGFVCITGTLLAFQLRRHLLSISSQNRYMLDQERMYRVLLENNNDVIIKMDVDGKVLFCSNNLVDVIGYTALQLNNISFLQFIHPADVASLHQCIAEIKKNPLRLCTVEFRMSKPGGEMIWIECNMVNHLNDPVIRGIIINARNIDQRKTAEEQHRRSEEKYARLFNRSPLPVWIYDIDTLRFIDVNEAAVIHYGYSRREFLEMTLMDIRPEEDVSLLVAAVGRASKHLHNNDKSLYRHRKKNGEIIFVRIESMAVNLEGKNYRMALAIDMTENLAQQNALTESNSKLKIAQQIASLGYWSQDVTNEQIFWSDEMYKIFGKSPDTFKPSFEKILSSVADADRHFFTPEFEASIIPHDVYEFEHRIVTGRGGEKWLFSRIKLTIEKGKVIKREGVVVDITQRKNDEAAIIKKSMLLGALNKFTASLLSNENWMTVYDKSMDIVGNVLKLDRIFYFENETDPHTGEMYASLKQRWVSDGAERTRNYPLLQQIAAKGDPVMELLAGRLPYEARLSEQPEGRFKTAISVAGVKTIFIQPVIVDGNFHGFFGFHDCQTERVWDNDEKLFVGSLVSNIATKIGKYIVETEVRKTKEQFASVITNLPGITLRRRASGKWPVIFVNEEIERLTGYCASDFIANAVRSFESIIHPDDRDKKVSKIMSLQPGESFSLEFRLCCKDGRIIWLRGNGRAVAGAAGGVEYIDEVLIDATETYEKRQQLVASNERFRTVMKAAAEAIIDWDITNDTVVWGDGFREFFGYDLSVYDNSMWSRNIHPDDKEWVTQLMDNALSDAAKENFYAEFRFLKANREVAYVQNRCTFIRDEHGKAIRAIGALADVTESINRRQKIEKQNESLREIAWIQSHVIRSPLAALLGLVDLFRDREKLDIPESELLDNIAKSAHDLDNVIHDIVKKSETVSNV